MTETGQVPATATSPAPGPGPAPAGVPGSGAGLPSLGPDSSGAGGDAHALRRADRFFRGLSTGAATTVLVIIVAIAVFLVAKAVPALEQNAGNFFTDTTFSASSDPPRFGIAALAFGTVVSSVVALLLAVPVAVGVALFITHYAPRRLAVLLGYVVDLLAAVPSVVYGLWGRDFLNTPFRGFSAFLEKWLGWIPVFSTHTGKGPYGKSLLLAGVVLAVMVLPIVAAISREVFLQAPRAHAEAALALGATRWEMIRTAVLPYGRPGVISASLLGLGRALGETVAVFLVLGTLNVVRADIISPGGNTVAANIAGQFSEASDLGRGALVASGLALFVITLVVNYAARVVIARRREFSGSAS